MNKKLEEMKAEFIIKTLKRYAEEKGIIVRSTSDLSPLEIWLLLELEKNES